MSRLMGSDSGCAAVSISAIMRRYRAVFVFIFGWLALSACGNGELKAPDITYGIDLCERCGMVIDDARYAAAIMLENGGNHKFDDVGEMFAFRAEHANEVVRAWFVHDYNSKTWLRGETAFYVASNKVISPMGTGVAAFRVRAEAEAYAQGLNVTVLSFEDAQRELGAPAKR